MASKRTAAVLLLPALASLVIAQQGVLVDGNSQLPSCAQSCPLLQQAATACTSGGFSCLCTSAFLVNLKNTATGASVCAGSCQQSDAQQVVTWYNSNCGSDNGASNNAGNGGGGTGTTTEQSSSASGTAAATASNTAGSSGSSTDTNESSNFSAGAQPAGDWWSNHYQWIVMVIVLAILLPLLAWLAIWLKRRHDRKRDQIGGGFNEGITHRTAPMSDPNFNNSGVAGSGIDGSGRNSPARTRDAFMPYGYGYNRSESRLGSKQAMHDDRRSPLARGDTPMDPEKEAGMRAETPGKKKSRRVLVRERSGGEDSIETEKR